MDRPVTSTPRGICHYYNQPRGCFAGDSCKFLHGDPATEKLTPFDKSKTCIYFAKGYCRRGENCWFLHANPGRTGPIAGSSSSSTQAPEGEDPSFEDVCCICFERPVTYGLLGGCSHVFCVSCIRQWRDPAGKSGDVVESGVTKKCPMCRAGSRFITPSSRFFPQDHLEKSKAIERYKESMARVPCRYFQQSKARRGGKLFCPFGKDCFYQHLNDDGTPYLFTMGVDQSMRIHVNRQRNHPNAASAAAAAASVEYLAHSLEVLNLIFDNPMDNLGATIDAIRAGLGRIGGRAGERGSGQNDDDGAGGTREREWEWTSGAGAQWGDETPRGDEAGVPVPEPWSWGAHGSGGRDDSDEEDVAGTGWGEVGWETGVVSGGWGPTATDRDGNVEELEILTDHVLATLARLQNDSEEAGAPRNLEIITMNPLDVYDGASDDDDEISVLEAVWAQSPSTIDIQSLEGFVQAGPPASAGLTESQRQPMRAFDLGYASGQTTSPSGTEVDPPPTAVTPQDDVERPAPSGSGLAWPLSMLRPGFLWGGSSSSSLVGEEGESGSSRPSNIVRGQEDEERMIIDIEDEEEEVQEEHRQEDREDEEESPIQPPPEPPFVTDGRGRVVWSSSGTGPGPGPGRGTHGQRRVQRNPPGGRVKSRRPDVVAEPGVGGGFMTDGRGRVIGTSSSPRTSASAEEEPREEGSEAVAEPPTRSLLGRVFGAMFPS